jgi:isopentenyl-diphosphate delta-isomerase
MRARTHSGRRVNFTETTECRAGSAAARQSPFAPAPGQDDAIVIPAIAADGSLFPVGKMEAHRRGILHQAVSVFVFSGDELLIQRRAAGKYHCGLQWANTCCTHPYWGEDEQSAAHRRVHEELGVSLDLMPARALTYAADVTEGLFEHERVQVFRGVANKGRLQPRPDPDEVEELRWVSPGALRSEIGRRPMDFTPWFRIYLTRWAELWV